MLTTTTTIALLGALAAPALAADGDWSFLVMGDWGGSQDAPYTTPGEISTAAGMDLIAGVGVPGVQLPSTGLPHFALALGDNFYSHGIPGDCHDPRFTNTFEKVFTGKHLQSPFEFKVVAGNHDHLGNVSAQIEYTKISDRWSFPTEYYTFTETSTGGATVQIVLIDTVVIAGISDELDANGEIARELHGSELPGAASKAAADAQLAWLNATLAASTADYLIVGGHYPIYSVCEHGPTPLLGDTLKPMLEQYKVTAYIAGHDHCMEYLNTGTSLDHHGIGSAHSNDPSTAHESAVPAGSLKWHAEGTSGGFASVVVTKEGLTFRHHQGNGAIAFTAPAHPPRNPTAADHKQQ